MTGGVSLLVKLLSCMNTVLGLILVWWHMINSSTQEMGARGSEVQGLTKVCSEFEDSRGGAMIVCRNIHKDLTVIPEQDDTNLSPYEAKASPPMRR